MSAPLSTALADAGSVKRLTRTLRTAKSAKARISAAVALAKLKDKRATPALIKALRDKTATVRAMAATALGRLGDRRALPALEKRLIDDDDMVRRRAKAAIARINKEAKKKPAAKRQRRSSALSRVRVDAQEAPIRRATPKLHVTVKSTADKSRGKTRKQLRKRRARAMKSLMLAEISGSVTSKASEAKRLGLDSFAVDASIVKLDRRVRGKWVEVECQIRLTISNDRGKMISFLTGGAKVQVPRTTYRRQYLGQMRQEALENAVKNVYRDLVTFLGKRTRT